MFPFRRILGALALAVCLIPGPAPGQSRPIVESAMSVHNVTLGAGWNQITRATLDDVPISPFPVGPGDVVVHLKVCNTSSSIEVRARLSHSAGAGATAGDLVRKGDCNTYSVAPMRVVELSLRGDGAAVVITSTWGRPS